MGLGGAIQFRMEVRGLRKLDKKLNKLGKSVTKGMLSKAVTQGLKPVKDEVKRMARGVKDTGTLARSITVKKVKSRKGTSVGIVGAWNKKYTIKRKARTRRIRDATSGKYGSEKIKAKDRTAKEEIKNPAKYAHLVELGTKRSRAKPIFKPAIRATKRQAERAMIRVLKTEVQKKINQLSR